MQDLLVKYQNLPKVQKRLLQIVTIFQIGSYDYEYATLFENAGLNKINGSNISSSSFRFLIEQLKKQNLILKKNDPNFRAFLHYVTIDACRNEEFAEFTMSIELFIPLSQKLLISIRENDGSIFKSISNPTLDEIINTHFQALQDINAEYPVEKYGNDWIDSLNLPLRSWVVAARLDMLLSSSKTADLQRKKYINILEYITKENLESWPIKSQIMLDIFATYFILAKDMEKFDILIEKTKTSFHPSKTYAYHAIKLLLHNQIEKAIGYFAHALVTLKSAYKKKYIFLPGIEGIFYIFALLKSQKFDEARTAIKMISSISDAVEKEYHKYDNVYYYYKISTSKFWFNSHQFSFSLLPLLMDHIDTKDVTAAFHMHTKGEINQEFNNIFDDMILYIISNIMEMKIDRKNEAYDRMRNIFSQFLPALSDITSKTNPYAFDLLHFVYIEPRWLRVMEKIRNSLKQEEKKYSVHRLIWSIKVTEHSAYVTPHEQTVKKNGDWSVPKAISLKRLQEERENIDFLTLQDLQIISCVEKTYSYYSSSNYEMNHTKAFSALVGHPLIFDEITKQKIDLTRKTLELLIAEEKDGYVIGYPTEILDQDSVIIQKTSPNHYVLLDVPPHIVEIAKILDDDALELPKEALEQILGLMSDASNKIPICAQINSDHFEKLAANEDLIATMSISDGIMDLSMRIKPFHEQNSYFHPGEGPKSLIANIDGINRNITRDIKSEEQKFKHLLKYCPNLAAEIGKEHFLTSEDLGVSLEILYEIEKYKSENELIVAWPKGQPLSIFKEVSFQDVSINVTSHNQWFEFNGNIEIDEKNVLELQSLLLNDRINGRFIQLDDKRFIALTDAFAKRLAELNVAAKISNNKNQLHKLASSLLQEFVDNAKHVTIDKNWKEHIKNLKSAEKYDPQVSKDLKAELRPYQIDGFKWLARLAHMGFGACLADDMGLGKTVQAISLLLDQAKNGPALVIAPASVCYVWKEECKKFAPTLNVKTIHASTDRIEDIKNLGTMDVLICSYGLLYQIEENLLSKEFNIIILDEAQAIKNFQTKRFKIISDLKSKIRIALSGTPVENRTQELWNLFEFLNPGFLGTRTSFQGKYAKPIEQNKDIIAGSTLRRLINPFVLRRTKDKVLTELPPKIEQTILVDQSPEEKNFYEALRRDAVERINNISASESAKKRFSILAEITKLRRACCDSSLASASMHIENSKLKILDEIMEELKENNHKALIFSQYVDYLSIVRKRLDEQKISYQYLDGSCTQKQRMESVEAFQSGNGDVFLISLKAGGVGLNLTNADYVIHLDPWWNPAVEDQASDRAHRMGQTKPVTVYRLVTKDSIEEKILQMHKNKRELAINLLSDADKAASFNEEDLLKLIMEVG